MSDPWEISDDLGIIQRQSLEFGKIRRGNTTSKSLDFVNIFVTMETL